MPVRPDKPGFWKSREGKYARVWKDNSGCLWIECFKSDMPSIVFGPVHCVTIQEGDWLPMEEPVFEEFPEKPVLLWTYHPIGGKMWRYLKTDELKDYLNALTILPHPQNDPEDVKRFEQWRANS